jgi:hypothetical protein
MGRLRVTSDNRAYEFCTPSFGPEGDGGLSQYRDHLVPVIQWLGYLSFKQAKSDRNRPGVLATVECKHYPLEASVRNVGLYGRLPASIPSVLHDLTYYAAGPLPKPPASVKVPVVPKQPDGTPWGMDGNDTKGDCGVAGLNHGDMAVESILGNKHFHPANDSQCLSYYNVYDGGQDNGVVLSAYLGYVKTKGFYGLTVPYYVPVAYQDIPTLQFTVDAYGFSYTGITVTEAMEQDFSNGEPWTLESLDSPVAGGHCVPIVGYDSTYLYVVTWGQVQAVAYSAWPQLADEAWAVITGAQVTAGNDGRGINLAALEADLAKLDS